MTRFFLKTLVALAAGFVWVNCTNKTTNNFANTLSGKFTDRLTLMHDVSETAWNVTYPGVGTCVRTITDMDSSVGSATYFEGNANCFNASKYGKTFFVSDGTGSFWYCDYLSGKTAASEVLQAGRPDSTTPATGGCNGSAWGKLTPSDANLALNGSYTDNWSSSHQFTNTLWTTSGCTYAIIYYDNVNGFLLYQQQGDAACWAANNYKFGKVFWAVSSANKLYYCQLLYDKVSYLTVANDTGKPSYTNPAASGCSGFSWTQLIR